MNHPDRVYSRAQLLDRVWGGNVYVEERTVDVHIRRLRKALTPSRLRQAHSHGSWRRLSILTTANVTLPTRWVSQLGALAGLLAGGLLLGCGSARSAGGSRARCLLYVAHTLRHLYALDRVLEGRQARADCSRRAASGPSCWRAVDKLRVKARSRKKKYHRLLREVRESTGALSDGGIILNADREILWFNPAAARLLGLNAATDIGNRLDNLLRHPDFAAYLAAPKPEGIRVPSPKERVGWLTVQVIPYGRTTASRSFATSRTRCSSSERGATSWLTPRTNCVRP